MRQSLQGSSLNPPLQGNFLNLQDRDSPPEGFLLESEAQSLWAVGFLGGLAIGHLQGPEAQRSVRTGGGYQGPSPRRLTGAEDVGLLPPLRHRTCSLIAQVQYPSVPHHQGKLDVDELELVVIGRLNHNELVLDGCGPLANTTALSLLGILPE